MAHERNAQSSGDIHLPFEAFHLLFAFFRAAHGKITGHCIVRKGNAAFFGGIPDLLDNGVSGVFDLDAREPPPVFPALSAIQRMASRMFISPAQMAREML